VFRDSDQFKMEVFQAEYLNKFSIGKRWALTSICAQFKYRLGADPADAVVDELFICRL